MRNMTRAWILLGILTALTFGSMALHADVSTTATMWLSSYTATADTTQKIACNTVEPKAGCRFHGVVISSAGAGSTFTVYNSSQGIVGPIVTVINTSIGSLVPGNTILFDVYLSSGLTYTNAGTTPAKVNILYGKPTLR